MSRGWVVLSVWAGFILFLAVVQWAIFGPAAYPQAYLLYVMPAAAVVALLAFAAATARRRGRRAEAIGRDARFVPDLSIATAWTGIAIGLFVFGLYIGPWLYLMAAGAILIGLGGIVRERRAASRRERDGDRELEDVAR